MLRATMLAMLVLVVPRTGAGQPLSTLHIKVIVTDAEQKATPVAHHLLLISDNPTTAAPRRVFTGPDGTADVKLQPGNYTVESDEPVAFNGKGYQWTRTVDIAVGRDAVLELTAGNAEVGPATSAPATTVRPVKSDPSFLFREWQDSVVTVWTPSARASGFVVDAAGLIATSQRAIGTATSAEVQLTPTVKVAASVLSADPGRDVAVLRVDPAVIASVRPVALECGQPETPVVSRQEIFGIGISARQGKDMTSGTVTQVDPHNIAADMRLERGAAGGPVFAADGRVVGITSVAEEKDGRRPAASRIVRIADACAVVASARNRTTNAAPPDGTHLPVEPMVQLPTNALKDAAAHRAGSLNPYQMSSPTFDLAFFTPVLIYAAQHPPELNRDARRNAAGPRPTEQVLVNPLTDFSNWSDYVSDVPPVLLVRVTPKAVEGFWTTVARGAAQTQGVSVPAIKHVKAAFSRMRAYCGDAEITPIHRFTLERQISEHDVIAEGLYAFDPDAFGPQCGNPTLVLYSDKKGAKAETVIVDPRITQQISQDFAPYRALTR
jgi:S1-C subfamily serine protease